MYSLHTEALAWLRYVRRYPIVCTEAGYWNADVIGMNTKTCVEIEVKKSRGDLRAEFKSKGQKHYVYSHAENFDPRTRAGFVPNFFYFFVSHEIADYALEFLQEAAPKAGLVTTHSISRSPACAGRLGVNLLKKATRLHSRPPSPLFLTSAMMRMGSEICGLRISLDAIRKQDLTEPLIQQIVSAAAAASPTLDFEDTEAFRLERAQELATAAGLAWDTLPDDDKAHWIQTIDRLFAAQLEKSGLRYEEIR